MNPSDTASGCKFLIHQSNRPAAAAAFSFSTGIALSLLCHHYSFLGLAAADSILIAASLLALNKDRLALSWTLGIIAVLTGGLLMALVHRDRFSASDLRTLLPSKQFQVEAPVLIEGCVEESESRGEEITATVALHSFQQKNRWNLCRGKGILTIPGRDPSNKTVIVNSGDTLRGWAAWHIPRDFENPGAVKRTALLERRGIYLLGNSKSLRLMEIVPGGCIDPLKKLANSASLRVRNSFTPIEEREKGQPAAILASLVIGDYSGLDGKTREIFQNSGTLHILVVSGLHVAWLSGLLLQFFKFIRLQERARLFLTALAIFLYTCAVGFQASITRCLWMFLLFLLGRIILRRADSMNILLISALILLIIQPYWLFEAGFQLSFLAVMAIATTAVPVITSCLKPLCEPMFHCGNTERLFLQSGFWNRSGRRLRVQCEILIEELTDTLPHAAYRFLAFISRITAKAALAAGSMIMVSLSIQLWLELLLAYYFNRISWVSPFANLLIVPLSSAVLAAGIIATLTSGLPVCSRTIVECAGSLSSLLLSCADRFTQLPGAWQRCPTPSLHWVLGGILLLFIWTFLGWRRLWIPTLSIVLVLACLTAGSVPIPDSLLNICRSAFPLEKKELWPASSPTLSFTFLDVGEGDSIIIRFPDKSHWIIDAGGLRQPPGKDGNNGFDIGEAVVSRYFWHEWIPTLDRLIITHPDRDHSGGASAVIKNFRIGRLDYAHSHSDENLAEILNIAREKGVTMKLVSAGMTDQIGPVTVRTVNPPIGEISNSSNENSIVFHISFDRFNALLTGDLDISGEIRLVSRQSDLHSQLLKVAHHGSRWGTTGTFLEHIQPLWAVVSVGRNPFGHPAPETIKRLQQHKVRPITTLDEGAITFKTDGKRYVIETYLSGVIEQGELK
jgi:competence protein ComEC